MQPITNNTQVILGTTPAEQQPVTNSHTKQTNSLLTSINFISDRSIYKFTNIISSKKFVSFCQQQDQQQALQKVTNIMSKHSYSICDKWIFSNVQHGCVNSNKTPIVFAICNDNVALAYQLISLMEKKYQQHTQDQPLAWLKARLNNKNNHQQQLLAQQISHAITRINIKYVVKFQGLIPYFMQNKEKAYNSAKDAIEQKDEQVLKLLLNNFQNKKILLSHIMLYANELTSKAIASNNINIIKQVFEFFICFYNNEVYLMHMIAAVIENNNYIIMKTLINIMKVNGISIGVLTKLDLVSGYSNMNFIKQSLLDYSLKYNYNNATLAIITSGIQLNNNKITCCRERTIPLYNQRVLIRDYSLASLFWGLYNPDNKLLTTENFNIIDILCALGLNCSLNQVLDSLRLMHIYLSHAEKEIIKQKTCNPPSLVRLATVNYAKNTLTKIGADFNLEIFKKNLAEYLTKNALNDINTIEDLFSLYCKR